MLGTLPTASVNQTVSISKTAVVTSIVHAVSALVDAELGHHAFIIFVWILVCLFFLYILMLQWIFSACNINNLLGIRLIKTTPTNNIIMLSLIHFSESCDIATHFSANKCPSDKYFHASHISHYFSAHESTSDESFHASDISLYFSADNCT